MGKLLPWVKTDELKTPDSEPPLECESESDEESHIFPFDYEELLDEGFRAWLAMYDSSSDDGDSPVEPLTPSRSPSP